MFIIARGMTSVSEKLIVVLLLGIVRTLLRVGMPL
jgi:hypothetical protein